MRQHEIKKKLDELYKIELVNKVRSERSVKSKEELYALLSPRNPKKKGRHRGVKSAAVTSSEKEMTKLPSINFDERTKMLKYETSSIDSENTSQYSSISNSKPYRRSVSAVAYSKAPHPPPPKSKKKKRRKVHRGLMLAKSEQLVAHRVQVQSMAEVTMKFLGSSLHLVNDMFPANKLSEIQVIQQHCGASTVCLFREMLPPNTVFTFVSRRHRGSPFGLTINIDGIKNIRISSCCEYKHKPGLRLGGKNSQFGLISVHGAAPCYRCQVRLNLLDQNNNELDVYKEASSDEEAATRSFDIIVSRGGKRQEIVKERPISANVETQTEAESSYAGAAELTSKGVVDNDYQDDFFEDDDDNKDEINDNVSSSESDGSESSSSEDTDNEEDKDNDENSKNVSEKDAEADNAIKAVEHGGNSLNDTDHDDDEDGGDSNSGKEESDSVTTSDQEDANATDNHVFTKEDVNSDHDNDNDKISDSENEKSHVSDDETKIKSSRSSSESEGEHDDKATKEDSSSEKEDFDKKEDAVGEEDDDDDDNDGQQLEARISSALSRESTMLTGNEDGRCESENKTIQFNEEVDVLHYEKVDVDSAGENTPRSDESYDEDDYEENFDTIQNGEERVILADLGLDDEDEDNVDIDEDINKPKEVEVENADFKVDEEDQGNKQLEVE